MLLGSRIPEAVFVHLLIVGCVVLCLLIAGVATADKGPPVKLRLLGEPRPAKAGEPYAGQTASRDGVTGDVCP